MNKVAFVSGGGGSIGGAVCRELAMEGWHVAVVDLRQECAAGVADEISASGGVAWPVAMNILDDGSVENAFREVIAREGRLDLLVNVAGGSARKRCKVLCDQDIDVIDEMLGINLRGSMLCMRLAARQMREQQSGCIVNIASVVALQGRSRLTDYAAAKGGIISVTRSLALEMGKYHVRVNCVSPGSVPRPGDDTTGWENTNILHSVCSVEDISHAVAFLASDKASFITGQNLCVDGGRSLGLMGEQS